MSDQNPGMAQMLRRMAELVINAMAAPPASPNDRVADGFGQLPPQKPVAPNVGN